MKQAIKFLCMVLIFASLIGVVITTAANAVAKVNQPKAPELLALRASVDEARAVQVLAEAEKLQAEAEHTHAQAQNVAALGGVFVTLLYLILPIGVICALWVIHKILSLF